MDTLFKALADPHRRRILQVLQTKNLTVGEIAEHFAITGPTLSHHLDVLKQARLVIAEREGQFIRYSLNTSVAEEVTRMILDVFQVDTKKEEK
jgi:ArsR family transcriptional regulator